ncbi:hypothetical protein KIN20_030222 [Parelaphostrongylus tenuis]|uniref:Uncharacterized protein n=1 Tax=Parelaphostrongylus tenuis TaxID=148309 RepID=A0AAD5WG61_PARTN|nr:hypothetical protein KIN20_030222 [Parelaphostrongylus tenuis]
MEPSREVICNLVLYEFQTGHNFQTAFDDINRAKAAKLRADPEDFTDASKTWRKGNSILHDLTQAQKINRKQIAQAHLHRHRRSSFLNKIVTIDEKWIFFKSKEREHRDQIDLRQKQ